MSETRKYIATTANNCVVSVDTVNSHAATHLQEQDGLWELAKEALEKISVTADEAAIQVAMGRLVGKIDLVKTAPDEPRIYGRRPNRDTYIPFVKRDEHPLTEFVVVILKNLARERLHAESSDPNLLDSNLQSLPQYDLFSTYIGELTPATPGSPYETSDSLDFWMTHALLLGSQEIAEVYDDKGRLPPAYLQPKIK